MSETCPQLSQLSSIPLSNSIHTFTLSLAKTMSLPTSPLDLIALRNLFFLKKSSIVLKDYVSKGMNIANDLLLLKWFLYLPPLTVQDTSPTNYQWRYTKQNESGKLVKWQQKFPDRYFNIQQSTLQTLFVMQCLVSTTILNGNLC